MWEGSRKGSPFLLKKSVGCKTPWNEEGKRVILCFSRTIHPYPHKNNSQAFIIRYLKTSRSAEKGGRERVSLYQRGCFYDFYKITIFFAQNMRNFRETFFAHLLRIQRNKFFLHKFCKIRSTPNMLFLSKLGKVDRFSTESNIIATLDWLLLATKTSN